MPQRTVERLRQCGLEVVRMNGSSGPDKPAEKKNTIGISPSEPLRKIYADICSRVLTA